MLQGGIVARCERARRLPMVKCGAASRWISAWAARARPRTPRGPHVPRGGRGAGSGAGRSVGPGRAVALTRGNACEDRCSRGADPGAVAAPPGWVSRWARLERHLAGLPPEPARPRIGGTEPMGEWHDVVWVLARVEGGAAHRGHPDGSSASASRSRRVRVERALARGDRTAVDVDTRGGPPAVEGGSARAGRLDIAVGPDETALRRG